MSDLFIVAIPVLWGLFIMLQIYFIGSPLFQVGDILTHENLEHWEKEKPLLEILEVGKRKYRVKSLQTGEVRDLIKENVEPFYKVMES